MTDTARCRRSTGWLEDAEAAELEAIGSLAQPVSKLFWLGVLAVVATLGIVIYLQLG